MIAVNRYLYGTIFTILLSTAVRAERDLKIEKLREQAKTAYQKQNYDTAIAVCDEVLRLDPKASGSHVVRGNAYRMKHDFERAIADYGEAIRLLSEDPHIYDDRGFAGNLRAYDKALALRRLLSDAYASRGETYAEQHDFERALGDFAKAISLEPRDGKLYRRRAFVHAANQDFRRAIADCDCLVLLAPDRADSHVFRGAFYQYRSDFEHALADFNEAIRCDPQYAQAFYSRGLVHWSRTDYAHAIADLEKAVHLAPHYYQACFALAQLFAQCSDLDLRDSQKALEYASKGCGCTEWSAEGYEIKTQQFAIPFLVDFDARERIEKILLFISEDKGKTWKRETDIKPSDHHIIYTAPHDGLYWFAVQSVLKDGKREPAKLDDLVPAMKVCVNSEKMTRKSQKSCEGSERDVEQLRGTVEQLEKKINDLESDRKPK